MNGSDVEREMVRWWRSEYDNGYAVRMPASGGKTQDELPDVLGVVDGKTFACELKSTSGDYASFTKEETADLFEFARRWQATPLLVARFSYDKEYYVMKREEAKVNLTIGDADSFSIRRNSKDSRATISDVIQDAPTNS